MAALATVAAGSQQAVAEEKKSLSIYAWRGAGTTSYLPTPAYQTFFRNAWRSNQVEIEDQPDRVRVLERLTRADVVYTNSHGGYLRDTGQHVLQTGPEAEGTGWRITGEDLELLRAQPGTRFPRLVVIAGSNMISPLPAGNAVVPIPAALGMGDGTDGRAFIGFYELVPGAAADRFFHVFFALWTSRRLDGTYRTLDQAVVDTRKFVAEWGGRAAPSGDDDEESVNRFIHPADAVVADRLTIIGDKELRLSDLRAQPAQPAIAKGPAAVPANGGPDASVAADSLKAEDKLAAPEAPKNARLRPPSVRRCNMPVYRNHVGC